MSGDGQTYAAAGVSLATAGAVVERLRAAVESTRTDGVVGAFGAFAGLFALDDERLLAASTDSVGSKLVLARRAGTLRWCGADLAAHGINDVATTGAEPLFFLDYVAAGTIDPEQVVELVEGAADVCRAAGCAILGGETAELPGIYRRRRARLLRDGGRPRPARRAGRRIARRRRATSFSASARRDSTRTGSPSSGGSSATTRSTSSSCCRRRAATSTTSARCAVAPTCARSRTSPAAVSREISRVSCRGASARSSTRPPGSGRPCSTGSRSRASPRTSCGVSSTSGSATAPWSGERRPAGGPRHRSARGGVVGVEWSDA